jgi:hypothetical protein
LISPPVVEGAARFRPTDLPLPRPACLELPGARFFFIKKSPDLTLHGLMVEFTD